MYQQYTHPSQPRSIDTQELGRIYTNPTEKILFELLMKFGRVPKDPQIGPNSQDLLNKIVDGTFKYPKYTLSEMEPLFIKDTSFICRQEGEKFKHHIAQQDAVRLVINVEKDSLEADKKLTKIQRRVALAYYRQQINVSMDALLDQNDIGDKASKKALLAYLEVLNDIRMRRGPQKVKKETDISRVVGLWLWDFINPNEVTASEAREEILEQVKKLYDYKKVLSARNIGRFRNNTGKCIESGEVLDIAHS